MKRVASLYLPDWPIERLAQAERIAAPPESAAVDPRPLAGIATQEQVAACAVPRGGGWRPGARWARSEEPRASDRRAGRSSEAAGHPFKAMPPDEGGTPVRDSRLSRNHAAGFHTGRHAGSLTGRDIGSPTVRDLGAPAVCHHGLVPAEAAHGRVVTGAAPARAATQEVPLPDAPRVTAQQIGSMLVIAAASPAARALGITVGMAVTQARAQIPGLDIIPADPDGDHAALQRLAMLIARRWCPIVMLSGEDGLFLDITGTAHLFGGEARMTRWIVRLLARWGFTARVAVADTPGAAWALARFAACPAPARHPGPVPGSSPRRERQTALPAVPRNTSGVTEKVSQSSKPRRDGDGSILLCPPAGQIDAIAPLPTRALRLDQRAIDLLKRLGIERVGQLAALPRAPLVRRFGAKLVARLDQATGLLPEPLEPVAVPEPIAVVQRFAEPIATAEAIQHWLGQLMPRLVTALAENGLGARAVELVADRIDGVPQRLRIGLARPTRDAAHLLRLTVRRIEEIAPGYGIDALALHVRRADPLGAEAFSETLEDRAPGLAPLIDTLANRIGSRALWRTVPVESDVPERSVAAAPALDPPTRAAAKLKADDVRQLDRSPDLHPWHPRWPRPVRLLRRPELLDHVMAELPDQPPRRFTWRGTTHSVARADGPERILGEWWKRGSERHSVRDYFRVEDETGQRFWLFRRGDGERDETGDLAWFMHGAFG